MRQQTTPEHPSQAHERVAFARCAFVTSTAADDLAIQAENCIPERENSCVQMVPCSSEHMHQPLSLRCEQLYSIRIQHPSERVSCQNFQHLSHTGPRHEFPGTTTGQRGAPLVPELLVKPTTQSGADGEGRLKFETNPDILNLGFYLWARNPRPTRNTWPSGWRRCIPRTFHGISVGGNVTSSPAATRC
jgi:hypothetical protein